MSVPCVPRRNPDLQFVNDRGHLISFWWKEKVQTYEDSYTTEPYQIEYEDGTHLMFLGREHWKTYYHLFWFTKDVERKIMSSLAEFLIDSNFLK